MVDKNSRYLEEPIFLNRFEKHEISFEYLIIEEMSKTTDEIYKLIHNLIKPDGNKFEASYDFNKLLVNCDKEEIQGIIFIKYKEFQKLGIKCQIDDLQDYVLEKISLTFPQDIILLMKYSGFEQKHNNISDKIIDFYSFIQTMKKKKNVIYTFTDIEEPLLFNIQEDDYFETEIIGKINNNNILSILISSIYSESELEMELYNFYNTPNKKILVLKFNGEDTNIIDYFHFCIENYLKENFNDDKENNKKVIIFSVHMKRIFESDVKDPKKAEYIKRNEVVKFISNLSDFYQIFIDDLNGEDISLIEIMDYKL